MVISVAEAHIVPPAMPGLAEIWRSDVLPVRTARPAAAPHDARLVQRLRQKAEQPSVPRLQQQVALHAVRLDAQPLLQLAGRPLVPLAVPPLRTPPLDRKRVV